MPLGSASDYSSWGIITTAWGIIFHGASHKISHRHTQKNPTLNPGGGTSISNQQRAYRRRILYQKLDGKARTRDKEYFFRKVKSGRKSLKMFKVGKWGGRWNPGNDLPSFWNVIQRYESSWWLNMFTNVDALPLYMLAVWFLKLSLNALYPLFRGFSLPERNKSLSTCLGERLRNENRGRLPEVYLSLFIAASLQLRRKKDSVTPQTPLATSLTHRHKSHVFCSDAWQRYRCPGNLALSTWSHPFLSNPAPPTLVRLRTFHGGIFQVSQPLSTFLPQCPALIPVHWTLLPGPVHPHAHLNFPVWFAISPCFVLFF